MKIKHFAGYGSVNATKISKTIKNGIVTMKIKVTGNHEWGLYRDDEYDCYNWLLSKFDKKVLSYQHILDMQIYGSTYETINGVETETCVYTFKYTY